MNRNGWSVLRVWHADVMTSKQAILETIVAVLDGRLTTKAIAADMKYLPAEQNTELAV
jgi:very-short-patch-repair endonuclease